MTWTHLPQPDMGRACKQGNRSSMPHLYVDAMVQAGQDDPADPVDAYTADEMCTVGMHMKACRGVCMC